MNTNITYHVPLFITDIVALKGNYSNFAAANVTTGILQRDLLCDGSEANLLECRQYTSGTRDCPADHSEDAGVKCNGMEGRREEENRERICARADVNK